MTQKYSQKYTVVCFFEDEPVGANFSALDWPLHITLLDTFKTDWDADVLASKLKEVARTVAPFDVRPVEKALLGPDKDVPVKLIRLDHGILALHASLLGLTDDGSFVYNSPEFVGKGFLPHATDQKDGQVQIGQKYRLANISLVDMFPDGDYMRRAVVDTFALKG